MQVIALAIQEGVPHPADKLKEFRKKHQLTYPIVSDEAGTIIQAFGFSGIPQNVVIDKTGKYVAAPDSIEALDKTLKKLTK